MVRASMDGETHGIERRGQEDVRRGQLALDLGVELLDGGIVPFRDLATPHARQGLPIKYLCVCVGG